MNGLTIRNEKHWNPTIEESAVFKELLKLKPGKAPGNDKLPPKLIKDCASLFSGPLTHLLALFIENGEIPFQWKSANVAPIPKSKPLTIKNTRPISLLPIFSKLLEKVVISSLKNDFLEIYGNNQFGFLTKFIHTPSSH